MSNKSIGLDGLLYNYLLDRSLREIPVLTELRSRTSSLPGSVMQISPEQGQLMALLLKLMSAVYVLEVGTFTGYSSLVMALALPENGKLIACDIDANSTTIAREFWQKAGVSEKIELRLAPALETLESLHLTGWQEKFDFAFIDADKGNYWHYYEGILPLMRPGGAIAIDNTLWSGRVADRSDEERSTLSIREFNQRLYEDDRVDISLIPIGDGLTLARKNTQ
jgi:predicted O-methyltransferase YrrM